MSVLATDNFNRANAANLGANWTVITNAFAIASNEAQAASGAAPHENYYNAVTWPNDQYSQVVVGTVVETTVDKGVGPAVRITAGGDLYFLAGGGDARVYKRIGGTYTQLGTTGAAVATGDVLYLEVQGTTLIAKKNGSSICGSPITDSALSAGNAGMWGYSDAAVLARADNWEGGDFAGGAAALSIAPIIQNYRNMGLYS